MSRAQQYPRLILALVCLPVFIGALDLTIVSAVLPEVIRSMTIEIQKLDVAGWVVTGYFVSYAISMTFMGKVSDIAGRRLVYLLCLAIFFVGSWLVAASPGWPAGIALRVMQLFQDHPAAGFASLYALIAGRVIQAFGAGAMVPVSMALVADLYPPEKRALPLGIIGAVDTAGWVLGHLYGGIMVQFMSWPYLFWINLPVVFVIFCITWWGLTGLPRMDVKGGIDWIGVTLLGAALVLLNVGLGAPEVGLEGSTALPSPHRLYWVAGAAVVFVIFLLSQRRVRDPILDLRIFSNRNLSAASGVNLLVGFCIMVALVSVPIFINVAGAADTMKAALVTGYLLCAFTVPMALAAIPGGWLSERLGYRSSVVLGLITAIVGFWMMSLWKVEMAAPGGRLLRQLATGPRAGRRSRHRLHGSGAGTGRHRHRLDHRADRRGGHQRRRRTGPRDGVVARHHPPPDRHERQHELDDGLWAAADDDPQPRNARPGRCAGFGKDGQSGARCGDEDHQRDGADFSGRDRGGAGRRAPAATRRRAAPYSAIEREAGESEPRCVPQAAARSCTRRRATA